MAEEAEIGVEGRAPEIAFDYIKGQLFHVVHADGVIGGMTPTGNIHVAFFSERIAIPQRELRKINPDGTLGDIVSIEGRHAIVREVDVDVMMSHSVAETLIEWLQARVSEARTARGAETPEPRKE